MAQLSAALPVRSLWTRDDASWKILSVECCPSSPTIHEAGRRVKDSWHEEQIHIQKGKLAARLQEVLLELPLAGFFLKQLLQRGCDVNDLPSLDERLYASLMFLRGYEGDVEDLALTFTATEEDARGSHREARLVYYSYPYSKSVSLSLVPMPLIEE